MEKQPFTSAGFAALQLQLYALPDAELAAEAANMASDFTSWMVDHFELAPTQQAFLNGLSTATILFLAQQTSTCVANRLPIYLAKDAQAKGDDKPGKIIRAESDLDGQTDQEGNLNLSGQVIIHIYYE